MTTKCKADKITLMFLAFAEYSFQFFFVLGGFFVKEEKIQS